MYQFKFISMMFLFFCMSCKSNEIPLGEYEDAKITFGNEGGFAGTLTSYQILKDGRVYYKGPRADDYSLSTKISRKIVKQLFSSVLDMGLDEISLNDPGNLIYFMDFDMEGKSHSLKWGAEQEPVDDKVKIYYRNLLSLVKSDNQVKTTNK